MRRMERQRLSRSSRPSDGSYKPSSKSEEEDSEDLSRADQRPTHNFRSRPVREGTLFLFIGKATKCFFRLSQVACFHLSNMCLVCYYRSINSWAADEAIQPAQQSHKTWAFNRKTVQTVHSLHFITEIIWFQARSSLALSGRDHMYIQSNHSTLVSVREKNKWNVQSIGKIIWYDNLLLSVHEVTDDHDFPQIAYYILLVLLFSSNVFFSLQGIFPRLSGRSFGFMAPWRARRCSHCRCANRNSWTIWPSCSGMA